MRNRLWQLGIAIGLSILAGWTPLSYIPLAEAETNTASIAGFAFWDSDLDGSQSLLETVGVPQLTAQLLDSGGSLLAETITAPDGGFRFDGLAGGSYTVAVLDLLACYSLNAPPTLSVTLSGGETRNDLRFPFTRNDSWCDDPLLISYAAGSCQDSGLDLQVASLDLNGVTGGTLDLGDLPGAEVDAFLLWSGAMDWVIGFGDPFVNFDGQDLDADVGYGPQVWQAAPPVYAEEYESWSHRAAVSAGPGQHSLVGADGFDVYASGAALFSLYRVDDGPAQQVLIADGLDQAQGSAGPSLSPGATRLVFPFEAASANRQARLVSVVGNVLAGQNSRLWHQTGNGAPPHSIVGSGAAIDNPFGTPEDMRWDVVETVVTIPVGATWLAVQLESGPAEPLPRLEWVAEALILPLSGCQSTAGPASVSGHVIADVNANGIFDNGEVGVMGLQVVVRDASGEVVAVQRSNLDGSFQVTGLPAGVYQILLDRPVVYLDSTPNPRTIALNPGQALDGVIFGLVTTTGTSLQSLEAVWQDGQVELAWQTSQEESDVAFAVLRSMNSSGPFQVISSQPIAAQGIAGSVYRFADSQVAAGQTYWYQVQVQPSGEVFGPISITASPALGHRLFLPLAAR